MADDFFDKLGDLLKKKPWYELPRLLADGRLVQMRTEMRKKNLHDTEEPPEPGREIPANLDPAYGTVDQSTVRRTICASRRWERPAGVSGATLRSSTHSRTRPSC